MGRLVLGCLVIGTFSDGTFCMRTTLYTVQYIFINVIFSPSFLFSAYSASTNPPPLSHECHGLLKMTVSCFFYLFVNNLLSVQYSTRVFLFSNSFCSGHSEREQISVLTKILTIYYAYVEKKIKSKIVSEYIYLHGGGEVRTSRVKAGN